MHIKVTIHVFLVYETVTDTKHLWKTSLQFLLSDEGTELASEVTTRWSLLGFDVVFIPSSTKSKMQIIHLTSFKMYGQSYSEHMGS
jgi:hypothetical protein